MTSHHHRFQALSIQGDVFRNLGPTSDLGNEAYWVVDSKIIDQEAMTRGAVEASIKDGW